MWLRVWGLAVEVWEFGCGIWGLGLGGMRSVELIEFRFQVLGFRASGLGF